MGVRPSTPCSWKGPRPRPHPAPESGRALPPSAYLLPSSPAGPAAHHRPPASLIRQSALGGRCEEPLSASASDRSLLSPLRCPRSASHMAGAQGMWPGSAKPNGPAHSFVSASATATRAAVVCAGQAERACPTPSPLCKVGSLC